MVLSSKVLLLAIIALSSLLTFANATQNAIDINGSEKISLLEHSSVYLSRSDIPVPKVIEEKKFKAFDKEYLNLGISKTFIYVHFKLKNPTDKKVTKALVVHSTLLEEITLYTQSDLDKGIRKGINHLDDTHRTLPYYFTVSLAPMSTKEYYLKIHSSIRTVGFSLTLENKERFIEHDRRLQAMDLILIGIVMALMLYSFFLSYFIGDRSYFFYGLYLFMLLYQQSSYLGIIQLYFPTWFIHLDTQLIIVKISLLLISAALFSISFLEIKHYPVLKKIYYLIIGIAVIEAVVFDPSNRYALLFAIAVSTIYIFFNLYAGIYVYKKGLKQARLFILGVGMVSALYIVMLVDVLGIASLMRYFNTLLLFGTAIEAFILSLAFADRYMILQEEKREAERKVLYETQHRSELIEAEVEKKTKELNHTLETKDILMREIHHRVKNNLQLILSIIRLQNMKIDDKKSKEVLNDLSLRINAIANTYNMLLGNDNLEEVDMKTYIETLLEDISESYDRKNLDINIFTDIDATMPIKKSIYVGLIINELVSNSYKHAFKKGYGSISIKLKETQKLYTLSFEDSGKGFEPSTQHKSLGLKLVRTLVEDQLDGSLKTITNEHTKFIIEFSL